MTYHVGVRLDELVVVEFLEAKEEVCYKNTDSDLSHSNL